MRLHPARWALLLFIALTLGLPALWWASPSSPVPAAGSASTTTPSPAGAPSAALARVTAGAEITDRYRAWLERYEARGGDRAVEITLSTPKGLTTASTARAARGTARLDLPAGSVELRVEGLDGGPHAAWLVDNRDGAGRSVLPEVGDRMARLGDLGDDGRLRVDLGTTFFRDFELDLIVVTAADATPADSRVLVGGRGYFERLYTKTRTAGTAVPEAGPLAALRGLLTLGSRTAHAVSSVVLLPETTLTDDVAAGGDLFFHNTFGGNGRTCGTCHPAANNQTLDPEFIATLAADDPLFVAERSPADGGVPGLEVSVLMRQFGQILENVDGAQDPTNRFVMRSVPHTLSLATSITAPAGDRRDRAERTGWSGDGAPDSGALRFFSAGAVFQHTTRDLGRVEGTDFTPPTDAELDRLEAYMLANGRTNDLDLDRVRLTSPVAAAGLQLFTGRAQCNRCHHNAGADSILPGPTNGGNANFDTGVEDFDDPSQAVSPHPRDGGFGTVPRRNAFGDGTFNTPPLVEAADTGPYFHNHAVESLEDAIAFYDSPEFNQSPGGRVVGNINLNPPQIRQLAAFLRVLNAAFNVAQARHRLDAAIRLESEATDGLRIGSVPLPETGEGGGSRTTVDTLLALANVEALDAVEVLTASGLHPQAVADLRAAVTAAQQAAGSPDPTARLAALNRARQALAAAAPRFGTGLDFDIGEGNLRF